MLAAARLTAWLRQRVARNPATGTLPQPAECLAPGTTKPPVRARRIGRLRLRSHGDDAGGLTCETDPGPLQGRAGKYGVFLPRP
jgi:hypothetical protein